MMTIDSDGVAVQTFEPEMVEVTVRVPEQFFTTTYTKDEWEQALTYKAKMWNTPGDLTDTFRSDLDIEKELYGPDGQQVALW